MPQSVHVTLAAHAGNPARFHQHIDATLTHTDDGGLRVEYRIRGLNLDLRVPTPHAPAPAEALWQTTCCELFLEALGQPGYREFNFSPSGQWAAYDFVDTRRRSPHAYAGAAPQIAFARAEDLLSLTATLPKAALPKSDTLRLAVTTILAAEGGFQGYWALAHPSGQPDFHHHAGFVLSLSSLGFRPTRWP